MIPSLSGHVTLSQSSDFYAIRYKILTYAAKNLGIIFILEEIVVIWTQNKEPRLVFQFGNLEPIKTTCCIKEK